MKHLTEIANTNPRWKIWLLGRRYYHLEREYTYYSERYGKHKTAPPGQYDGCTWALDVNPVLLCIIHDACCVDPYWDDGTPINSETASMILYDLLRENNHKIRAPIWRKMTKWFGCKNTKEND